jgi:hypothetical protein
MSDKKSYCKKGQCTATCLEELKSCAGYEPSIIIHAGGCCYLAARSGKCLRPEGEGKG